MGHKAPATGSQSGESPAPRRARVWNPGWAQQFAVGEPIDVSVCIANWNCCDHLRACLQSLLEQPQGVSLEVIVVDNASTDGSADMVAREFPEVTLIRNETNRGFSRANNQAAASAQGRHFLFLNNDTVVPANTLLRLVGFADRRPDVGMIGPRLRGADGRQQISYRQLPTAWALLHRTLLFRWTGLFRNSYRTYRRNSFEAESQKRVDVLMGAAVLVPRDVFHTVGRWDESYDFGCEDIDLSHRVGARHEVIYLPSVEIVHHGRVSSRQNIGYSESNVAAGYVRFLRSVGTTRLALIGYKLAVTLDVPFQLAAKTGQFFWRTARSQPAKAKKTALAIRGLCAFLRSGLRPFWSA